MEAEEGMVEGAVGGRVGIIERTGAVDASESGLGEKAEWGTRTEAKVERGRVLVSGIKALSDSIQGVPSA